MDVALQKAEAAAQLGEVPVACAIVQGDTLRALQHNLVETKNDPTAHAELLAIQEACAALGTTRLQGCTAFVTLEPCPMCAAALSAARISLLVYACADPKTGACRSLMAIPSDGRLPHTFPIVEGVLGHKSTALLQHFFKRLRG
jgi:tRNA(adenine34) deaminase